MGTTEAKYTEISVLEVNERATSYAGEEYVKSGLCKYKNKKYTFVTKDRTDYQAQKDAGKDLTSDNLVSILSKK